MSVKDEIDKAVSAHGMWKHKLRSAIESGESESTADKVSVDTNCSFGKWLYKRIDPSAKGSLYYTEVLQLHAEFHLAAGEILRLALLGEKDEANRLMGLTGDFAQKSGYLTKKMKEWQASL